MVTSKSLTSMTAACIALWAGTAHAQRLELRLAGEQGDEFTVQAGETFTIEVFAAGLAPVPLRVYNVMLPAKVAGSAGGEIALAGDAAVIDKQRKDYVFRGVSSFAAASARRDKFIANVVEFPADSVVVDEPRYLGEFPYKVSADAAGEFKFEVLEKDVEDPNTFMLSDEGGRFEFDTVPITVRVASKGPRIVHAQGRNALTAPCSGYVDPHVEIIPGNKKPGGIRSLKIKFTDAVVNCANGEDITTANFEITETGGGSPPTIVDASYIAGDKTFVRVKWDRPLTPREWTTIRADVCDTQGNAIPNRGNLGDPCAFPTDGPCENPFDPAFAEPDRIDLGRLPGDIDQNRAVEQARDYVMMQTYSTRKCDGACPDCGGALLFFDIDHDPTLAVTPMDLHAHQQTTAGLQAATIKWEGVKMRHPRP